MRYRTTRRFHMGDRSSGVGTLLLMGEVIEWDGSSGEAKVLFTDKVVRPESDSFRAAVRKGWMIEIKDEEPRAEDEWDDGWNDDPLGL